MINFIYISPEFRDKAKEVYAEKQRKPKNKLYRECWIGSFTFSSNGLMTNEIKKK